MTSGFLNSVQISNLYHQEFVEYLQTKKQEEEAKAKYDEVKKKRQITDLVTKIATIRQSKGHERDHHFSAFNFSDCGTYLQYKRQNGNPAMPKHIKERRER